MNPLKDITYIYPYKIYLHNHKSFIQSLVHLFYYYFCLFIDILSYRDSSVLIISGLYGLLLVVIGSVVPMAETFVHRIRPYPFEVIKIHSNMTSIKRHKRYYSITLLLAQVRYTTNLAVPCDPRCEITVTTECKQTKHRHITYF
jgi:hypothetical protein